ncbi:MAG: DUF1538 domain-containing protein [Chloroflexota bacterium]
MKLKETVLEVVYGILPITVLITLLQITIIQMPWQHYFDFLGGALLVTCGLILFLLGVNIGLVNTGEAIGSAIATSGSLRLILAFGFMTGFAVTVPEPDVQVLALQVRNVSQGDLNDVLLVALIALGVGAFTAIALLKIFINISIYYFLAIGYAIALIAILFSSPEYVAIAFDAGGVTTGSLTVPFILSLGVGVAAVTARSSSSSGFGILGLASLGPVLSVLLLGILNR